MNWFGPNLLGLCFTLALLLILGANRAFAQQQLPRALLSSFGNGPAADFFEYSYQFDLSPVKARITFSNRDSSPRELKNKVWIEWTAIGQIEGYHFRDQIVATTYQPTAVARHNGKTDVLYVAGWVAATGEVVIEKWTFELLAYPIQSETFPAPTVVRMEIMRSSSIQPISGLVRNPNSNQLWMLEWEMSAPKRLLSLDLNDVILSSSSLSTLYDGNNPSDRSAYPLMKGLRHLHAGTHPTAGWIVYAEKRPTWRSLSKYSSPYTMLVGFDGDQDGVLDSLAPMTYRALYTAYPYAEWIKVDG